MSVDRSVFVRRSKTKQDPRIGQNVDPRIGQNVDLVFPDPVCSSCGGPLTPSGICTNRNCRERGIIQVQEDQERRLEAQIDQLNLWRGETR